MGSRDDTITRSINILVRFGTNVYSRMAKLGNKPTNLEAETFVSKVKCIIYRYHRSQHFGEISPWIQYYHYDLIHGYDPCSLNNS